MKEEVTNVELIERIQLRGQLLLEPRDERGVRQEHVPDRVEEAGVGVHSQRRPVFGGTD